jgi:hypothetical protein
MSPKFKEILQQAKDAKETFHQIADDIVDTLQDVLNVDPYSSHPIELKTDH